VHKDGTARAQVVSEATNPRFHRLIRELERRTGKCRRAQHVDEPRGEPIVCTPTDALDMFFGSDLAFLIMEDLLLTKIECLLLTRRHEGRPRLDFAGARQESTGLINSVRRSIFMDAVPRRLAVVLHGRDRLRARAHTGGSPCIVPSNVRRFALRTRARCGRPRVGALVRRLRGARRSFPPRPSPVPIPGTRPARPSRNYTYWATDIVLKNFGFVEEEFFFEGTANRYDAANPSGGVGNAARCTPIANVVTSDHAYKSRMRVIRPTDPAKFNGTVVVEWTNVTNGYDTPVWWLKPKAFYLREGYAYVEVSAQNAGLNNQPQRPPQLEPDALRHAQRECRRHALPTDVLSYDIFSQAAAAVRNVPVVLGGLQVQRVIGVGESQSAGRLGVYANARPSRGPHLRRHHHVRGRRDHLQQRAHEGHEGAERDGVRRADQRDLHAAGRHRHLPHVAGRRHVALGPVFAVCRAALLQRDIGSSRRIACATPARSRVETRYFYASSIDAMVKWIRDGIAPPIAGRFVLTNRRRMPACSATASATPSAPSAARRSTFRSRRKRPTRAAGRHARAVHDRRAEDALLLAPGLRRQVHRGGARFRGERVSCWQPTRRMRSSARRPRRGARASNAVRCARTLRQFPLNPSSMLLRNQTAFLIIRGADFKLLPILDKVDARDRRGLYARLGNGREQAEVRAGRVRCCRATRKRAAAVVCPATRNRRRRSS
jgi:hypothetical protein